ncbi:hypothetical protein V496_08112 [Pseudogymnoascus sp. VKM F-4515 (FW-2607)]|nr:hypothetical protein V496_08112 [Pseudogymnoascus sp. VKM F-4515 (FW-2607)]KFY95202.1 hypothetical protein V498_03500 [Pseudogymnoascus sp. VKM F-4517 (FW-2822)]
MEGESIKPNVKSDAKSATDEMYASNEGSELAAPSHGDDALANLMDSMEQFVAEDSTVNHDANDGATDQKHETRGSRRLQRTNAAEETSDTRPSSSETVDAIPAKRPQTNQASSQAPKKAKKGRKGIWSVENVLQNPKSPLVNANLKGLFSNPEAWNILDKETKAKLISMLPESTHVLDEVNGELRISESFLKFDQNWAHYLGRAQEDIAEGRNDPIWLEQAAAASEQRTDGEFDDWKDNEYEVFWGVKQKLQSNVLTGLSGAIKFNDLVTRELIKPGDIFLFQRTIGKIFIEKEIKFIEVLGSGNKRTLRCSLPPGASKFSKGDEDIINSEINGPERICKAAIDADGRLKGKPPNGNSWKTVRILRNNQDVGTLWDIRQALHISLQGDDD